MNAPLPKAAWPFPAKPAQAAVIDKHAIWLNAYNEAIARGFDTRKAGQFADTELAKVDEQ